MKRVIVGVVMAGAMFSSPAAAAARAYSCSGPSETFRVIIGPGEMRRFVGGAWGNNWCDEGTETAPISRQFQGTRFVASVQGETTFTLDTSTGAFFDLADPLDDSSSDERGRCQAE
jgi:hypothetical protein